MWAYPYSTPPLGVLHVHDLEHTLTCLLTHPLEGRNSPGVDFAWELRDDVEFKVAANWDKM